VAVRTPSRFMTRGMAAAAAGYSRWVYFFVNSLDILLTPTSMIFSERRGAAVAAVRTRS
jgi:hypothetical protein